MPRICELDARASLRPVTTVSVRRLIFCCDSGAIVSVVSKHKSDIFKLVREIPSGHVREASMVSWCQALTDHAKCVTLGEYHGSI